MSAIDICQRLEKKSLELIAASGLERGWGFPTGCSLNHVAAHYTPNYGDATILQVRDYKTRVEIVCNYRYHHHDTGISVS